MLVLISATRSHHILLRSVSSRWAETESKTQTKYGSVIIKIIVVIVFIIIVVVVVVVVVVSIIIIISQYKTLECCPHYE